jgi:hypothetical protein
MSNRIKSQKEADFVTWRKGRRVLYGIGGRLAKEIRRRCRITGITVEEFVRQNAENLDGGSNAEPDFIS